MSFIGTVHNVNVIGSMKLKYGSCSEHVRGK